MTPRDRWDDLAWSLERDDAEDLRCETEARCLELLECDECGERPARCQCVCSDPAARPRWMP